MDKMNHSRRKILSLGATTFGTLMLPSSLLAATSENGNSVVKKLTVTGATIAKTASQQISNLVKSEPTFVENTTKPAVDSRAKIVEKNRQENLVKAENAKNSKDLKKSTVANNKKDLTKNTTAAGSKNQKALKAKTAAGTTKKTATGKEVLSGKKGVTTAKKNPRRMLYIKAVHFNKTIKVTYFDGRKYIPSALTTLNSLFRDRRNNKIINIDPKLYDKLYRLQQQVAQGRPIFMLSGYRSAESNRKLRETSSGVASNSFHISGKAVDFYIPGVTLQKVLHTALRMNSGGVGYYPRSNFVHLDTGPVRYWPKTTVSKEVAKMKRV